MDKSNVDLSGHHLRQLRVVIVGATGMVGGYALRYALEHPAVGIVTAIGRKKLGISHPKLKEILHSDFADCSALAGALSGQDAAVFCLGAYTGAVPEAADFPDEVLEQLEVFDGQFFEYPHNLTDLLFAYVAKHPDEFGDLPTPDA